MDLYYRGNIVYGIRNWSYVNDYFNSIIRRNKIKKITVDMY